MAVVPLTGLNLLVSEKHLEAVLHYILNQGTTHPIPAAEQRKKGQEDGENLAQRLAGLRKSVKDVAAFLNFEAEKADFSLRQPLTRERLQELEQKIQSLQAECSRLKEEEEQKSKQLEFWKKSVEKMDFFLKSNVELKDFTALKFLAIKYGRIPLAAFNRLANAFFNRNVIVNEAARMGAFSYMFLYFSARENEKVTETLRDLHFEEVPLSPELKGSPRALQEQYLDACQETEIGLRKIQLQKEELRVKQRRVLADAYVQLLANLQIKECQKELGGEGRYYINRLWIPKEKNEGFLADLEEITGGTVIHERFSPEELGPEERKKVPTILKNSRWLSPFEFIVEMYGKPSYFETDPTPLLAVSFVLMFGMMFGDVGQGLFLLLLSRVLAKRFPGASKAMAVLSYLSASSAAFGLAYGEVFGFHLFNGLWLSPMHDTMDFLKVTVVMGVVFMSTGLVLNLRNAYRRRDWEEFWFGKNGISGIFFYWGTLILLFWLGVKISFLFVLLVWLVPAGLMLFREPLGALLRQEELFPHGKVDFLVGAFFEMLDTMIGFLSNTVSFVRVAAFALNHIGLFSVIILFTKMIEVPRYDILIDAALVIFGNLFIIFLEGFIVTIQVLRLEYYEIFSKFFSGTGLGFSPLKYRHE